MSKGIPKRDVDALKRVLEVLEAAEEPAMAATLTKKFEQIDLRWRRHGEQTADADGDQ